MNLEKDQNLILIIGLGLALLFFLGNKKEEEPLTVENTSEEEPARAYEQKKWKERENDTRETVFRSGRRKNGMEPDGKHNYQERRL